MAEFARDPPIMVEIKLNRRCIRADDAKMQCFIPASGDFSLPLREQTLAYPTTPAFAKHP
jgi:hypothetical protein